MVMQEAFDAAYKGYEECKFGFLDVLDAQRGVCLPREVTCLTRCPFITQFGQTLRESEERVSRNS